LLLGSEVVKGLIL